MIRPYFACGRRQLRIGWKKRVIRGGTFKFKDWEYHFIGLTWQL